MKSHNPFPNSISWLLIGLTIITCAYALITILESYERPTLF